MRANVLMIPVALMIASCATARPAGYDVEVKFSPDEDGLMLYMLDYDTGAKIDSAMVDANGIASMKGEMTSPYFTQLILDGQRAGNFILEPAKITYIPETRTCQTEGKLNGLWRRYNDQVGELQARYRQLMQTPTPEARKELDEINRRYDALTDSLFAANSENPIGYSLFIDKAHEMSLEELEKALKDYPQFASSKRIEKLIKSKKLKLETSEGQVYKDFAVTYDGATKRLSDYVGNGKYTLVDFWASWCGPCIRQTAVIKDLYNKYHDKGLDVLGVAVWDEPANTLDAVAKHQLPWPQIINAQSIPTDIYGISGIPCIILFDPNGKIVSRDKQDQALVDDVDAAMKRWLEASSNE